MALRCLTCDILLDSTDANDLNKPVLECKSFIMAKIYEDCLQMEPSQDGVICDGCKVQLILFYQFRLKVVAIQQRRMDEMKMSEIPKSEPKKVVDVEKNVQKIPENDELLTNKDQETPKEYNCPYCSATFMIPSALEAHVQGLHSLNDTSPFKCIDCNQNFESKEDLETHKNEIHIDKSFVCHFCGGRFTKATGLRIHLKLKHSGIQTKRCRIVSCDVCQKVLSNKSALYRHKNLLHNDKTKNLPFLCQICQSRWPSKSSLTSHHLSKHSTDRKFKCAVCEKNFATKYQLVTHINRVHCYTKDFVCHTCGKSFKSQTYLNTHYLVHSQTKEFICDDCGVAFKQEASLYAHRKCHREIASGVKHECKICQLTFKNGRTLKKHEMTHSGPDLQCDHCDKTYKQKDSLTKHMMSVHNRVKMRVVCRVCHKTLWNRSKMRSHVMEVHAEVLGEHPEKSVDDYLENIQIHEESKQKTEKKNLEIISVQILNRV